MLDPEWIFSGARMNSKRHYACRGGQWMTVVLSSPYIIETIPSFWVGIDNAHSVTWAPVDLVH